MAVAYSKKRLMSQAVLPSFISKKLDKGEILTVIDVMESEYESDSGQMIANDMLIALKSDGSQIKIPVKEYNKFSIKSGESYLGNDGSDDIMFPDTITIIDSEDRMANGEDKPRYATHAYTGAQEFFRSKDKNKDYKKMVIDSPLKEPLHFDPLQNYTVELK